MLVALLGLPGLALAHPALAFNGGLDKVGGDIGGGESDLPTIVGSLVDIFLGVIGIILFVLVIYSGFLWMTAGGNSDKVETAKKTLINAVIGLLLTFAAYAISSYALTQLGGAVL